MKAEPGINNLAARGTASTPRNCLRERVPELLLLFPIRGEDNLPIIKVCDIIRSI